MRSLLNRLLVCASAHRKQSHTCLAVDARLRGPPKQFDSQYTRLLRRRGSQ